MSSNSREFDRMKEEALKQLENVPEKEYDELRETASPEQLLLVEAIKNLTEEQRQVWEWYAYDRRTEEEIGEVLGVTQQSVHNRIEVIQNTIKAFCKQNRGAYMLLKLDQRINEEA